MSPAEAEPWLRCRSSQVEEMGEALPVLCGRDARAPGWTSGWLLKNLTGVLRLLRTRFSSCLWGHWGPLFHSRMIRTAVRGENLPATGVNHDRRGLLTAARVSV